MNLHQEIRVLNTATGLIASMLNYEICCFPENKTEIAKTILPQNYVAKKYFFILLLDLFSDVNKEMIPVKNQGDSLINILRKISINPLLNSDKELTVGLNKTTTDFLEWLDTEFEYDIYSANISKEITIYLSRRDALYLIGNRCKHTLVRSNIILKKLVNIYRKTGLKIEPGTEILLLEDIDNWLFEDFGGYHFTKLCELCSNLYYSIYNYVGSEARSRMILKNDMIYSYKIPECLTRDDEIFEFYELLNHFRSPWIPRIKTWEGLLTKY